MGVLTNLQRLDDHGIKKLLFLYWEIVEKTNVNGTVKDEITLAVNALRKDLESPNEFIRGRTLRLVSKIHVQPIVEDLVDCVITNLNHRNSYVRRNAIMCLYAIFTNFGLEIVENSIDDIEKIMIQETDLSTKRNSFLLLFNIAQDKALSYLEGLMNADDPVAEMGDIFQLMVIEMLRKLIKSDSSMKSSLLPIIFMMSKSKSSSVLYECASTIVQLTTAPSAVKVAIQSFLSLLTESNDNNVKVIVLDNLMELRKRYSKVLEDYMIDILSVMRDDSAISYEIS
jgi:coatomer subunit beta